MTVALAVELGVAAGVEAEVQVQALPAKGGAAAVAHGAGVRLQVRTADTLNWADFQNAVPVLTALAVVNDTALTLHDLTLELRSEPEFVQPRTWHLTSVGAGATYALTDLNVQLDGALLSRLNEAEPAAWQFVLRAASSDAVLATHRCTVELLPRNQWGGLGQWPASVAAFVQPNDPAVDRLLKGAALALQAVGKSGAIDGYTHGARRAWELASGLWASVSQCQLAYALPPASFEQTGQKVRSPGQVLDAGLATCLDLALLFAACLEQAHLNPLLVFTRGHVLVGLWLRDEQLPHTVLDDITALRTRVKLQELLVFETTLVAQGQPVAFSQAIASANRQLSANTADAPDAPDSFCCVVDVQRARRDRIKPLALAQATIPVLPPEPVNARSTVEDAPDLPQHTTPERPDAELEPKDRLERWQRKLLDLSLRNALLNFKPSKKTLPLDVAGAALEDALADGQTLKLLPSPALMQGHDPRSQALHEARSLEDLRHAQAAEALQRREVLVALDAEALDARLVDLYRGARQAMQEGGANTLFVALGFLVWSRRDKPEVRIQAPLVLLPVTLNRKSARAGFTVQLQEGEPLFNPTLLEMLRQDFQLDLGLPVADIPRDSTGPGLDIPGIWARVRNAIKNMRGWEVSEDVVLSMFSFAKYLMWKDLTERTDALRQSPVVAHLMDTPREPFRSSIPFPDVRRLDTDFAPQQVFCPLPADSSQLAAVMAAAQGKDFVLIGPPGTGKSQTIANLIAQCLADNKRVLFVAEKIAALDVVYRRLREVGLGDFCLELHSNKSRKLDVLKQLQTAWDARGEVDAAVWLAQAQQLSRVREQLSGYVARLHHRHPNGYSVYQAIGCVASHTELPELHLHWPAPDTHDQAALAHLRGLASRLQANAAAVGPHNLQHGPCAPVYATDWSVRWQQDLVRAAQAVQQQAEHLASTAQDLGQHIGLSWPALNQSARRAMAVLLQALPQAAPENWSFCALPNSRDLSVQLKAGILLLHQHHQLSAQMSTPWPVELLAQRQRLQQDLGTPWPGHVSDALEQGLQCLEALPPLHAALSVRYSPGVFQLNLVQLQRDWAQAQAAFWPLSWLGRRRVQRALQAVTEDAATPRIADDLATLVRIQRLQAEVNQLDLGTAGEGFWAGLKTRPEHARSALKANAALRAARLHKPFALDGLHAVLDGHCGERWAQEAQRLQELQDLEQRLSEAMNLHEASHVLAPGQDAATLHAALAFERERMGLRHRGSLQAPHTDVAQGRCGPSLQQQHALLQARSLVETQLQALQTLSSACPGVWRGLDTNPEDLTRALRFHALLHAGVSGLGLPPAAEAQALASLHHLLDTRHHELAQPDPATNPTDATGAAGPIGARCQQVLDALNALQNACDHFSTCAAQPEPARQAWANATPAELSQAAAQLQAHHSGLHAWCAWRHAQASARSAGLAALVQSLETGTIAPEQAPNAFEANYARWWLAEAVDADEVLKRFVCAEHENRIQAFRALDDAHTQTTRDWIRAQLCASLPTPESAQRNSEWGVLRREITKKRQHLPLRQLLQEIPSVVQRLTPCLLMSPLSIAQYLSANACDFDLVVFDEASQIPVWDAIGAMARGKQVVMVGDPKQLPPTHFFARADNGDDDDPQQADLESILDECLGASLPTRHLSWHYRSRHESLIAFSNHRYYGGGLVTFPSPVTNDRAVSFHWVDGRYAKGGARTNPPEAQALVAELVQRLQSPGFQASGLTIGVVTFNAEQQSLIEDLLDEARRQDPGLEPYFADGEIEPVFVKNLESVQGDERDIMYFSITYGPDLSGTVSMNFGPLNRDGGERRLNVAVTRARHELRVFSSLRGDQMDLSRTQAAGVRDLKHFLEFAEHGPRALAQAHHGSQGDFESPFEASVAAALGRKGWQVHTQIGASSFRIDLGVVHPDFAGRYLAGVECDGATYHRSATARDRDKLREQVLRGLGWEIVRIWSTDWWVNPGGTLEQTHAKLSALLERERSQRSAGADATAEVASTTATMATTATADRPPAVSTDGARHSREGGNPHPPAVSPHAGFPPTRE